MKVSTQLNLHAFFINLVSHYGQFNSIQFFSSFIYLFSLNIYNYSFIIKRKFGIMCIISNYLVLWSNFSLFEI